MPEIRIDTNNGQVADTIHYTGPVFFEQHPPVTWWNHDEESLKLNLREAKAAKRQAVMRANFNLPRAFLLVWLLGMGYWLLFGGAFVQVLNSSKHGNALLAFLPVFTSMIPMLGCAAWLGKVRRTEYMVVRSAQMDIDEIEVVMRRRGIR